MNSLKIGLFVIFGLVLMGCNQSKEELPKPGKPHAVQYSIKTIAVIGIDDAATPEEEPYLIASIRNIDCDAKGNLYVVESKTNCVKVFNQQGKFLRKMFSVGKGPKEIYKPAQLRINKFSNTIFIANEYGYKMKQFSPEGEFLCSILLPEPIQSNYDFLSRDELIYIADCKYRENTYHNFKVLNLQSGKITRHISPMTLSDRSDTYNTIQRFVIRNGILWTSTIDRPHLIAFDLSSGEKVKELTIKEKYKKNTTTSGTKDGMTWLGIVDYNYSHPIVLNGELFAIWVIKTFNEKVEGSDKYSLEELNFPKTWKSELYRVQDDDTFEKIGDIYDCDHMRMETTFENRIIFSGNDPYFKIKIVEVTMEKNAE